MTRTPFGEPGNADDAHDTVPLTRRERRAREDRAAAASGAERLRDAADGAMPPTQRLDVVPSAPSTGPAGTARSDRAPGGVPHADRLAAERRARADATADAIFADLLSGEDADAAPEPRPARLTHEERLERDRSRRLVPDRPAPAAPSTLADAPSRPAGRTGRSRRPLIIALVTVAVLAVGAGLGWMAFGDRIRDLLADNDYRGAGNGTSVQFAIIEGDTGTDIGDRLEEAGIVKTSRAFVREVLAQPDEPTFEPGTYLLQKEMSAESALDALLDPANRLTGVVAVPEGTAEQDVYQLIAEATDVTVDELTALAEDPSSFGLPDEARSLEGFLFPATYEFQPGDDARTILEAMVARTMEALDAHDVPEDRRWDVIRLASLVQKEAGLRADYPKVARVFLNRIDEGMNLQSDATVAYGTGNTHRVSTTDSERADASNPYNTYVHPGMVVRPISNPGDIAIDAAMHPADGTWLYFVTVNLDTGETVFSTTFEEHEQAVAQWQAWMAEHPEYQ